MTGNITYLLDRLCDRERGYEGKSGENGSGGKGGFGQSPSGGMVEGVGQGEGSRGENRGGKRGSKGKLDRKGKRGVHKVIW